MDKGIMRIEIKPEEVQRGQVISQEQLMAAYDKAGAKGDFGLFVLKVRSMIEDETYKAGDPMVLCQKGGGLHVLDDPSASEYVHNLGELHLCGFMRCRERLGYVRTERLTRDERSRHERRTMVMDEQITAIEGARNRLGIVKASKLLEQLRTGAELPALEASTGEAHGGR